MKRTLKQYLQLTKTMTLSFFRNKEALFFVLIFPLIFMIVFGFMYADEGEQEFNAAVHLSESESEQESSLLEIIAELEALNYQQVDSVEAGKDLVRNLEADFFLALDDNQLDAFYNPTRVEDNSVFEQQVLALAAEFDRIEAGLKDLVKVEKFEVASDSEDLSQLAFMFPGLIALGLAAAGLFVFTEDFMAYRKKRVLKRMLASPMKKEVFLFSLMSSRFPSVFLNALLVLVLGNLLFGVSFNISWLIFIPYLVVATIIIMAFGALLTLIAGTNESATQAATIFLTIMIFFSGIYFPVEFLPIYFQRLSLVLPLSYIARGLRFSMGIEDLSSGLFLLETTGLLFASLVIIFLVSEKIEWNI